MKVSTSHVLGPIETSRGEQGGLSATAADGSDAKDRDFLFRLLTEEIRDRHELGKLEGWTPWLAAGALIGIAWLLVQDLWSQQLQFDSTRAVFIVSAIVIVAVRGLRGTLNTVSGARDSKTPFSLLHATETALGSAIYGAWFMLLAVACLMSPAIVDSYPLVILGVIFVGFTIVTAIAVVIIALRLPIPISRSKILPHAIITSVVLVLSTFSVKALLQSQAIANARLADIRAGALLSVAGFGVVLLSRGQGGPSTLKESLVELRQEIALGKLSTADARQRTRVALQGMFLSDFLQDDVRELLKSISEVRGIYNDAFHKISTLKDSVIVPQNIPALADFEKLAIASTLDVLQTYEERISEISNSYFSRLKSVRFRLSLVSRLTKAASSDEAMLITEIERAQSRADADLERYVREFYEIQSAWNRWFPNEIRQHAPFGKPDKQLSN